MDTKFIQNLETYIKTEIADAALYRELAKMAPNEMEMNLIMEMAADEQSHADELKLIYKDLTGEIYRPSIPPIIITDEYEDVLRDRVIDESGDYRRYMYEYQNNFTDENIRETFYNAAVNENVHAIRLLNFLKK